MYSFQVKWVPRKTHIADALCRAPLFAPAKMPELDVDTAIMCMSHTNDPILDIIVFLDKTPMQDDWMIYTLLQFSKYPVINDLTSCNYDYAEQPIYEIECLYSDDSDSDKEWHYQARVTYKKYLKKYFSTFPYSYHLSNFVYHEKKITQKRIFLLFHTLSPEQLFISHLRSISS